MINEKIKHINIDLGPVPIQYLPNNNDFISKKEIEFLINVAAKKNGNMLEIGVNYGKTTNNLARVAKAQNLILIGIDVLKAPLTICDAQSKNECLPKEKIGYNIADEHKDNVNIKLIDPNEFDSLNKVLLELGIKYKFVFIDGDHSYEGVKKDFETLLPFMDNDGIMIFHDVWWDIFPPPVKGPLRLLTELGGYIINNTHLGILNADIKRL